MIVPSCALFVSACYYRLCLGKIHVHASVVNCIIVQQPLHSHRKFNMQTTVVSHRSKLHITSNTNALAPYVLYIKRRDPPTVVFQPWLAARSTVAMKHSAVFSSVLLLLAKHDSGIPCVACHAVYLSHARYQLGVHVTGLTGCGAACKDDRTFSGLVCEKFTELCYVWLAAKRLNGSSQVAVWCEGYHRGQLFSVRRGFHSNYRNT